MGPTKSGHGIPYSDEIGDRICTFILCAKFIESYRRPARSGFRAGTVMALSVGACDAWAPRAALDFFCVMHRRRWPLAGPRGGRRPPTAGRSRGAVMVASALNLHLKRRRLYAGRPSAALAIRKIASALNLHLKGRRLAQVFTSYTRARRRRRCSFLRIRLAALRWSSEQLRGRCRRLAVAAAS